MSLSPVQLFVTPWTVAPTRLLCPWNSSGKNTGVGCHSLLQGIFPIQGSNLGLLGLWVQSLGFEDPLEKRMVTHSSILAWRIS